MSDVFPSVEELVMRVRRGEASPPERRRLEILLRSSEFERWLFELGQAFDAMPTSGRGDEAMLDAVVSRISLQQVQPRSALRRPLVVLAIGALSLVSVAAAALSVVKLVGSSIGVSAAGTAERERAGATPATAGAPLRPNASWSEARDQFLADEARGIGAAALPSGAVAPVASVSSARALVKREASPGEQFAAANALRKSGQAGRAMAAYQRLQKEYPESSEAALSHVVLGRLLLQRGAAAAAERHFKAYLEASPSGGLAEEALHGQASALRQRGRASQERRVWQRLLIRFPRSIYAQTARDRLRELD